MAKKNKPNPNTRKRNQRKARNKKFMKKGDEEDHEDAEQSTEEDGFEEVGNSASFSKSFEQKNGKAEDSDEDNDAETKKTRKLVQQQNRKKKKSGGFQSMGLSHNVYKGVIRKGYKIPTPIQRRTIPLIMDGKDVVAMARTGSGKTAAFLVPMFENLKTHSTKGCRAILLAPTRELALQTLKFTKELGKYTGLKAAVILGGDSMEEQFAAIHENPDIIIATPGRFMHVVVEMELKLHAVEYIVFDEADRLFEMGFQEQLQEILQRLPDDRQTLLFSATLPKLLVEFARAGLHDPTLVRLDVDTKLSENLKMSFMQCRSEDKLAVLLHLLRNVVKPSQQTVIFAATKHHVEYLNMILEEAGMSCSYSYSSLDQTARKINVAKFRNKKTMILIVTDLAARGIDIPMLDNVINFNFPAKPKLFVHRVGRVARAGQSGTAYSLICPDEVAYVIDLHLFLGRKVNFVKNNNKKTEDDDGLYGLVPQQILDDEEDNLRAWQKKTDVYNMMKVIDNAYKQYIRSRPAAASESIKRSKEVTKMQLGYHPIYKFEGSASLEQERSSLLSAMKSYRPNTTIFEINSTKKAQGMDVMKQKRRYHTKVIHANAIKEGLHTEDAGHNSDNDSGVEVRGHEMSTEDDIMDTFVKVVAPKRPTGDKAFEPKKKKRRKDFAKKDEEHYIDYRPKDFQTEKGLSLGSSFETEAANAMMDMAGDEDKEVRRIKGSMRWDQKKKKYVRESGSNEGKHKKVKTESGNWIPASYKKNIYKDWLEKNKVAERENEDSDGNEEEPRPRGQYGGRGRGGGGRGRGRGGGWGGGEGRMQVIGGDKRRGRGFHTTKSEPGNREEGGRDGQRGRGRGGRREIKTKDQILKQRKQAASKQAFAKKREIMRNKKRKMKQRGK